MAGFYRSDNPLRDFWNYTSDREEELKKRPVCDQCDEHIQDDYYYIINNETFCPNCMEWHKRWID